MRILTFPPGDTRKRFIITYVALANAPIPLSGRDELHRLGAILSRLEGIAEVVNPNRGLDEPPSFACRAGGEIEVSDVEHQLVRRCLDAAINLPMLRPLSRELGATLEWIDNVAETKEPVKA